jgi:hypothetical protein
LSVVGETSAEDDESSEVEDDEVEDKIDATPGARGVDFVATSLVRVAKSSRAVLASLLLRRILTAALIVWLALHAFEKTRGFSDDEASSFSSLARFFSGEHLERLFTSRDSDVADVARWKRRAALLELELQALERRAAFVAERRRTPEPRSPRRWTERRRRRKKIARRAAVSSRRSPSRRPTESVAQKELPW